ncbi:MAG: UMP kinase [Clostridia bacterium]|nr:UMP kinase [Clostridia bacterium]
MENLTPKYKRVLLKLSGEALAKDCDCILNFEYIEKIAEVLKKCVAKGVQVAVVVGAGNIWRGRQSGKMDRAKADQMGMLATAINSLALEETFNSVGLNSRAMTVMEVNSFADPYRIRDARRHLDDGEVVIIGGGTGMPFFSTDTAAAIHAAEIGADVILMAKNIDGIYNADPHVDPTAKRYDEITYREILDKELKALDIAASAFCMENNIKCYAFALSDPENIYRVIMGEKMGTELHR